MARTERRHRRTDHLRCAVALAIFAAGCSGGPEQALLDQFFQASRLRDLTALERVSTVIFEPRQDGTVVSYTIISIRRTGDDSEEVLVNALVRLPSGSEQQRPLVVTLKRTKDQWMVAAVHVSTESTSPVSRHR